ncbi:MAG: TVP38/TMEM64 family protein [Deltaproteobacteria bacterium]|nr:TVP38/TMEM64 family protein [Deltaproteobacteria bacterium]
MTITPSDPVDHPPPAKQRVPNWLLLSVVVIAIVCAYVFLPIREWLSAIAGELRALGVLGIVLFIVTYTASTLVLFPAAVLSLGAGFAWGVGGGFAVAVPAATIAATTGFLIARYLFHGKFRAWLMRRPRLAAIDDAVNQKGAFLVFLLRFSPVFPVPLLNYAIGLSHIRLRGFVLATFFGLMPINFLYAYTGSVGEQLSNPNSDLGGLQLAFLIGGLVVTVAVTWWVTLAARKALRDAAAVHAAIVERAAHAPEARP